MEHFQFQEKELCFSGANELRSVVTRGILDPVLYRNQINSLDGIFELAKGKLNVMLG